MGIALVGLLGVIAGGLITGGVQAFGTYTARRLETRTAARLLHMTLLDAHAAVNLSLRRRVWGSKPEEWDAWYEMWVELRQDMSRAMPTQNFATVVAGFTAIQKVGLVQRDSNSLPAVFSTGTTRWLMQTYLKLIEDAETLTWRAGFPVWFRVRKWWPKRWQMPPSPVAQALSFAKLPLPQQHSQGPQPTDGKPSKFKRFWKYLVTPAG